MEELLANYSLSAILMAMLINVLTNIIKIPIKKYSAKSGRNANKFISLIPMFLGLIASVLYHGFINDFELDVVVVLQTAVTFSSLSLAIFAILEKFFKRGISSSKLLDDSDEFERADNKTDKDCNKENILRIGDYFNEK